MKNCLGKFKTYATRVLGLATTKNEFLMCKLFPLWENDYPLLIYTKLTIP